MKTCRSSDSTSPPIDYKLEESFPWQIAERKKVEKAFKLLNSDDASLCINELKELFPLDEPLPDTKQSGFTLFSLAIARQHDEIVTWFMDETRLAFHSSQELGFPLLLLLFYKKTELAKQLIRIRPGIQKNHFNHQTGNNALHYCMEMKEPDVDLALLLCENNPGIAENNIVKQTPILIAAQKDHFQLIQTLCEQQPDFLDSFSCEDVCTILDVLLYKKQNDLVETILNLNVTQRIWYAFVLLSKPDLFTLELLQIVLPKTEPLSPEILTHPTFPHDSTLLQIATNNQAFDAIAFFVEEKMLSLYSPGEQAVTLFALINNKHYSVAKKLILLTNHPDIFNFSNSEGNTVLHACMNSWKPDRKLTLTICQYKPELICQMNVNIKSPILLGAETRNFDLIFHMLQIPGCQLPFDQLTEILFISIKHQAYYLTKFLFQFPLHDTSEIRTLNNIRMQIAFKILSIGKAADMKLLEIVLPASQLLPSRQWKGKSPLYWAVFNNHLDAAEYFIRNTMLSNYSDTAELFRVIELLHQKHRKDLISLLSASRQIPCLREFFLTRQLFQLNDLNEAPVITRLQLKQAIDRVAEEKNVHPESLIIFLKHYRELPIKKSLFSRTERGKKTVAKKLMTLLNDQIVTLTYAELGLLINSHGSKNGLLKTIIHTFHLVEPLEGLMKAIEDTCKKDKNGYYYQNRRWDSELQITLTWHKYSLPEIQPVQHKSPSFNCMSSHEES